LNITELKNWITAKTGYEPKPSGEGFVCRCPAHDDKTPSLSISESGGKILLHCHAGCSPEAICSALGLKLSDLFTGNGSPARIMATYPYHDAAGKVLFEVVRYDPKDFKQRRPDSTAIDGWTWNTKGVNKVLFRLPEILRDIQNGKSIFICEGEKDALAMVERGFSATCNPGGAGKWQDSYTETLRGADAVIIADKDVPGRAHAALVAGKLHGVAKSVRVLELPDAGGKTIKDTFDFFAAGGDAGQIGGLVDATPAWTPASVPEVAETFPTEPCRPLRIESPETPMDFKQWQAVISANFPAYARPAEICAGVVAQLLLNDVANPFALALVDVPASGKTITLNFFAVPELAYTTDNFTPASFVSHASNVRREELAKVDLLPRIRYRTLIVRDLAPIFGVKEDELLKTMGILTRALDGEGLETDSGVHGKRGYKGDWLFMLLAGTTPIPPRVFKVMGTLGSRLFFLALHPNTKSHDELIAQNRGMARREKERACREATDLFLRTLWAANPDGVEWNKGGDPEDCLRVIARCAELLAVLRGAIQMWQSEHDGSVSHNMPVIEQPDRINCLLYNLARGHALLCGRTQLEKADLASVLEVTFDSAPTIRSKVFRGLLEHDGTLKTSQVEKLLRCSKPTALKEMEALAVLGVADKTEADPEYGRPEHELRLAEKFEWFANDECKALCWQTKQTQGGNP
jgi:predicted transcriptional regulator